MSQPDDATAVFAGSSLTTDLELAFTAAHDRAALAGDEITRGSARWRRLGDGRWTQDPIAHIDFTARRRR